MRELLKGIRSEVTIKNGLLFFGEKRLELGSREFEIIADNCWDIMNEALTSEFNNSELGEKFINALKYNFYINFEESEEIFFNTSPEFNTDYDKFINTSFKWSNSSRKDSKRNFLDWFELIFNRPPSFVCEKIFENKHIKINYFNSGNLNYLCEISFDSNHEKTVDIYSIEFQEEFCKLEKNIQQGLIYIIDSVYYYKNKRYFSEYDIEDWTPLKYKEKLHDLGVWDTYVQEVFGYYKKLRIPGNLSPYEYYKKFTEGNFLNFADFVSKSFYWAWGVKTYSWWYKTVFGEEFQYEGYGLTNKDLSSKIDNYKDGNGYSRSEYIGDDPYTDRDAFIDAYSDGFSEAEDDRYFNNDNDFDY